MGDKGGDTAFILHIIPTDMLQVIRPGRFPEIGQNDPYARVEKCLFPEVGQQCFVIIGGIREDRRIRLKHNASSGRFAFCKVPDNFEGFIIFAAIVEMLVIDVAIVANGQIQRTGQRVDNRSTDAMQAARHLISAAAELAARVQNCIDNRRRRNAFFWVHTGRDAAAVVGYPDCVARQNLHCDFVAESRQRFINRIVDNFLDQMMQTCQAGRANIHARTFADRFQSFQNLYLRFIIMIFQFDLFF